MWKWKWKWKNYKKIIFNNPFVIKTMHYAQVYLLRVCMYFKQIQIKIKIKNSSENIKEAI